MTKLWYYLAQDIPEQVPAGSHLKDIIIESVDEDGQVDITMDGTFPLWIGTPASLSNYVKAAARFP
jgi:hypothetical protein